MNTFKSTHDVPNANFKHGFSFTICLVFLLFPNISNSQDLQIENESNNLKSFLIQGGIYYDYGKENIWGEEFNLSFLSLNKIGIGGMKFTNNRVEQMTFDLSWYNTTLQYEENGDLLNGMEKSKFLVECEYFTSLLNHKEFHNNLHVGYLLSAAVSSDESTPLLANRFASTTKELMVGLGAKAIYAIPLGSRSHFFVSGKLNLIDVKASETVSEDPIVSAELRRQTTFLDIDFLRPRVGLDFGIMF